MSLTSIIGQDVAVRQLRNMINSAQLSGAYLFLGPDGVGKRMASIEFSKSINCEANNTDCCDTCISCAKINSLNHPDVFIIEKEKGSSNIKIEKIREMIYQASLKPYEGRKKVFIILDAEYMTEEAQNALLKLLEEPPANQILILTTSRISGMLQTVLSRCKVLKFNLLSQAQVKEILVKKHNFNEEEAMLFSHMAMGSPGRAVAFRQRDGLKERDRMLNDFFFKKRALFKEELCDEKNYEDLEESLRMLLCWYRDLLVSKFTPERNIFLNIDKYEEIFSYGANFSAGKLERDLRSVIKTLGYVRKNINSKMVLFNMALELERQ